MSLSSDSLKKQMLSQFTITPIHIKSEPNTPIKKRKLSENTPKSVDNHKSYKNIETNSFTTNVAFCVVAVAAILEAFAAPPPGT